MDTPNELNEIVLPQPVVGALTRSAIFLVLRIRTIARLIRPCALFSQAFPGWCARLNSGTSKPVLPA